MKNSTFFKAVTPLIAIAAITAIEITALTHGINGVALAGSMAAIGGLGGYEIKALKDYLKRGH